MRKKYASVIWKRERDVMIVFPDMSAMMFTGTPQERTKRKKKEKKKGSRMVVVCLYAFS